MASDELQIAKNLIQRLLPECDNCKKPAPFYDDDGYRICSGKCLTEISEDSEENDIDEWYRDSNVDDAVEFLNNQQRY